MAEHAWPFGAGRLSRRQSLRAAATAAVGGSFLAACGPVKAASGAATRQSALPTPAAGTVQLMFQANYQFIPWNATTKTVFQEFVDQHFNTNPQYRGIWATVYPAGWGNEATQYTDDIAGKGYADVFMFCCTDIPNAEHAGIAAPLDTLLKQDNISTSNWSPGHILADSYNGSLYGLPSYDGEMCIFYRQDILDSLGLAYPDPSWNSTEAAKIWTQCAGKNANGTSRAGLSTYWDQGEMNEFMRAWGGLEMNATQDRALMDSQAGINAMTYWQNLYLQGAVYTGGQDTSILPSAKAVFAQYHSAHVVDVGATLLGSKYKWDILPNPSWPGGKSTFCTIDCYMLNAQTKHPQEAWELMKWINLGAPTGNGGFDNAWPKFQIQINLVTPSLVSLWEYWQTEIQLVAPPLKGKGLQYFAEASQQGYGYPTMYFKYQPIQAVNIENQYITAILGGKTSPQAGLQQMAHQVNALESVAAAEAQQTARASQLFPATGPTVASVVSGI
jgi:ABC-type glycerol-3-phosphate transport system substrate-binding protein